MNVVKTLDSVGRIVIPRDLRRSLRWMDGDEIEIILNDDGTVLLRKHENDTAKKLKELSLDWKDDIDIQQQFAELISMIENKIQ